MPFLIVPTLLTSAPISCPVILEDSLTLQGDRTMTVKVGRSSFRGSDISTLHSTVLSITEGWFLRAGPISLFKKHVMLQR